ncbi:hypothetical protein [Pedobacter sp. Hv1]|uniref:hypothetical protein n=1 Tax=Pedobacter sp. Hv1 TaxID=1740090 RepID=UPI0006D8B117|nr:hypothetical protein [Pedobacter sp. Hv1]KQC01852.1 hypothetical protein AQF98_05670 [Pedobacter sp. Hv1]
MKQKTDYIFFGLTGLLIASTLILSQLYGHVLTINNYLAFVAWPIALFLRMKTYQGKRYPLGIILLLALFNIINFEIGGFSMKFGINSSIPIETPGINPIILLIVVAYYIINKERINHIISNFFKGTEEERSKEFQKTVDFYLHKFNACEEEELKGILKNFNDYPDEAKIALRQIQANQSSIL